jgi:hypothetical protein
VGRKAKKPRPGAGPARITFLIDAATVRIVDEVAEELTADDPFQRRLTRTDALRLLIREGIKARRGK